MCSSGTIGSCDCGLLNGGKPKTRSANQSNGPGHADSAAQRESQSHLGDFYPANDGPRVTAHLAWQE